MTTDERMTKYVSNVSYDRQLNKFEMFLNSRLSTYDIKLRKQQQQHFFIQWSKMHNNVPDLYDSR